MRPGSPLRLAGRRARYVRLLKRDAFSENHLVELDGRLWVLKRSRPLGWLARRERRNYRRLEGIPGVPALGPVQAPMWLLHAWVPGRTLQQLWEELNARMAAEGRARGEIAEPLVPPDFYLRLGRLLDAVHGRGLVYLDLSKKANVIVAPDGSPQLIDFQISCWFGRRRRRGLGARLFEALVRSDRYQLCKHARRHGLAAPDWWGVGGAEPAPWLHGRYRRWLGRPWLWLRRRLLPRWW
ncbi:MAG: hypothetical protein KatS3mg102_1184 [Planctomycetota bacterium]|nr:MAG: hypothetical protein KatS3mg102_1184 [Planctomycetota bacterium]